jgi:GNAT superfamily N-acetyltransferase
LIKELATYERAPEKVEATEESLLSTLTFSPPSASSPERGYARTLLILQDGEPAGMALYFYSFSTWTGRPGIFLEDLFVRPQYRRLGCGLRLLGELARELVEMGGKRLEWNVLRWNEPSIKF